MIIPWDEMLWRIGLASVFGLGLGLDRHVRSLAAGIRVHTIVALTSAVTMLIALELFARIAARGGSPPDPTRVIHGLAIAVGILCSGTIFVLRGNVYGLTTAAGLWTTSTLGVAIGAGQYRIGLAGFLFAVLIVTLVRLAERYLPGHRPAPESR